MPGLRPVVEGIDTVLMLSDSIAASELFTVSDPDGDPIVSYTFFDSPGASTGFFIFQGAVQPNGVTLTIDAEDLDDLFYVASAVVSNESISIRASDGTLFSEPAPLTIYSAQPESVPPIATVEPISILGNESVLASSFISAFDPDGFPILSFQVRDRLVDRSFFSLDGVELEQGVFHVVSADEFERLEYNAVGRRSENVDVFAFDGTVNSDFATAVINVTPNLNRPVVQFAAGNTFEGELLPLADLITFFDADGNTPEYFEFRDRSSRSFSGSLVFQGEELAPGVFHRFTPEEVDEVFFRGGERSIVEQVRYRASDGRFRSAIQTIELTNSTGGLDGSGGPELEAAGEGIIISSQLEPIPVNTLFTQVDDGLSITQFEILDSNAGELSAQLFLDGLELENGVVHQLTAAEFDRLEVVTGEFIDRNLDEIFVRGSAGTLFSPFERLNLRTEPEFDTALVSGASFAPFVPIGSNGKIELTYSFMQQFPDYETGEAEDNPFAMPVPRPFQQFTENQRQATRIALGIIETYTNIDFVEVADTGIDPVSGNRGGTFRFGNYNLETPPSLATSFTFLPSPAPEAADIWFNALDVDISNFDPGTREFTLLLNEIGTALGFSIAFDLGIPGGPDQNPVLPDATNDERFTLQSSFLRPDFANPVSFPLYDIAEVQALYGVNTDFNTGDDVYSVDNFLIGADSAISIHDAGGVDTLSGVGTSGALIDLRQGGFSSIGNLAENVSISFGTQIENAQGSDSADTLIGNELNNQIIGGAGFDVLRGFGGNDFLSGGTGNDTFQFSIADGTNTINEMQSAGRDSIEFIEPNGLDAFSLSDNLTFRLDGRDLTIALVLDDNQTETVVTIEDQTRGAFRIESVVIGNERVDLVDITDQLTPGLTQQFQTTEESTVFGSLAVPV